MSIPSQGRMRLLMLANVVTGPAFLLMMLGAIRYEGYHVIYGVCFPAAMALLMALVALAIGNIVAVFFFWRKYRFWVVLLPVTYVLITMLSFRGISHGRRIVLAGTPCYPREFLHDEVRSDLEGIAGRVLGHGFKEIVTFLPRGTNVTVRMLAGYPVRDVPAGIPERLRSYGFRWTHIDDTRGLVTFSYLRWRRRYDYLFTTNDLPRLYTRPVELTEADIGNWSNLIRIAEQGEAASEEEMRRVTFWPGIVYPYLQRELGDEFLERVRRYTSPCEITVEQKNDVLAALNKQRLVASRLVEHPKIIHWTSDGMLRLHDTKISHGFWVSALIDDLLEKGTLQYADDGRHLTIKANPSPAEIHEVEWVHVGLMELSYGGLLCKRTNAYIEDLGGGWYFNRW